MNALIIDGLNLIRRVYAGAASRQSSFVGDDIVKACVISLNKLLSRMHPSHTMCVMDSSRPSWRHVEYPDYKANRKPMDESLRVALRDILAAFVDHGVNHLHLDGFEADDVIASIAVHIADAGGTATVVSTDKSFCQLLQPDIRVYDYFNDKFLDRYYVEHRFDTEPEYLTTLFGLAGDSGLNIPGVHSVGVHTAAKLIHDYGPLENILAAAENMEGHIGAKLRAGVEDARLAARLLSLRTDIELGLNLKDFRYLKPR